MEARVTTSSGDVSYPALEEISNLYADHKDVLAQIANEQRKRTNAELELIELKKAHKELTKQFKLAERNAPLNDNDIRMLIEAEITLQFKRPLRGGCTIKATRNGRTMSVARGPEKASLLPQLIETLRAKLRE